MITQERASADAGRLEELRIASGWTRKQVARRIGTDKTMIRLWEQGAPLPHERIAQLAGLFRVSVVHLMGWDREPERTAGRRARHLQLVASGSAGTMGGHHGA